MRFEASRRPTSLTNGLEEGAAYSAADVIIGVDTGIFNVADILSSGFESKTGGV